MNTLPEVGFVRLKDIIGSKREGITPLIPVCRTNWVAGQKAGRFPKAIQLAPNTYAYKVEDVRALIATLGQQAAA